MQMSFIEGIKDRARKEIKTIILPEAEDIRTLKPQKQYLRKNMLKLF